MKEINCLDVQEQIELYIAGECDQETSEIIKSHLPICNSCAKIHQEATQFIGLVGQVVKRDDFVQSTISKIKKDQEYTKSKKMPILSIAIGLASCAIALITFLVQDASIGHINGKKINIGDVISAEAEPITVSMDKKEIKVFPGSKIKVSSKDSLELIGGTVNVNITEQSDFAITTTLGTAKAKGTTFLINLTEAMIVTVLTGSVQVFNNIDSLVANQSETVVIEVNKAPKRYFNYSKLCEVKTMLKSILAKDLDVKRR